MSHTGDQLSLLILCRQALRQSSALAIQVKWHKSTLFLPGTDCEKICKGAESPFKFPGCSHWLARTRGSDVSWARIHLICSVSRCTSHKFKSQRSHTDESFNVLAKRIAALDGVVERLRFLLIQKIYHLIWVTQGEKGQNCTIEGKRHFKHRSVKHYILKSEDTLNNRYHQPVPLAVFFFFNKERSHQVSKKSNTHKTKQSIYNLWNPIYKATLTNYLKSEIPDEFIKAFTFQLYI